MTIIPTRLRERLPLRHQILNFEREIGGITYVVSIGRYADGRLREIFIESNKTGSAASAFAHDAAILASIAIQYGAAVDKLRHALLRDARGQPSTPIGRVLDLIASEGGKP
jgi:ribonucleoside-diphosphate reductase alpha chain